RRGALRRLLPGAAGARPAARARQHGDAAAGALQAAGGVPASARGGGGMNRYDLAGRTAIVTGGAGGIGRAIASAFIASGAHVCLWDRNETALAAAVSDLGSAAEERVLDITDAAAGEAAARDCHARWGCSDSLANNHRHLREGDP